VKNGLADDLALWHEWERASSGRRAVTWSVGLKDRLGVHEVDDQELAEEDHGGETELVLEMPTWKALVGARLTLDLLEVAETAPGAAEAWLDARGWAWKRPPAETEGRHLRV
jgi:hypothetical protein